MKILLAEDDFASRKFMSKILDKYGEADITVNGLEAVDAFLMALDDDERYDLVILDVMMPMLDGYQVLSTIRKFETERNFKPEERTRVIMTTALNEEVNVKPLHSPPLAARPTSLCSFLRKFTRSRATRYGA